MSASKKTAGENPGRATAGEAAAPWYREGLRFTCSECGDCCTGAPGFVWVNQAEIDALAARLKMEVGDFERKYVRAVGVRRSLIEFANGDCVFFDPQARNCKVYEDRPRQCRTWPFWESNLKSPQAWKETCEICPGSGQGKLHALQQIVERIEVIRV
ncbi:MAG: YkgJ family cysteine cluster protein [Pirellulales bacterium]|nr:YkgJ family cysteine cluster protein [Pirellulales bacterium]